MEWVSSLEAIRALGATGDCAHSVEAEKIRQAAERGEVETRASRFRRLKSNNRVISADCQAFYSTPTDGSLPDSFWRFLGEPTAEVDWETGRFSCFPLGVAEEWRAEGVEFLRTDIVEIGGTLVATEKEDGGHLENSAGPRSSKGGRPVNDRWPEFVAELCVWLVEGGDPLVMNSERLLALINDRLAKRGREEMLRSTARPTLKVVLSALRKASIGD